MPEPGVDSPPLCDVMYLFSFGTAVGSSRFALTFIAPLLHLMSTGEDGVGVDAWVQRPYYIRLLIDPARALTKDKGDVPVTVLIIPAIPPQTNTEPNRIALIS